MSDFLTRLAERQLDAVPGIAPRAPSRFAPAAPLALDAPDAHDVHDVHDVTTTRARVDERPAATTQRIVVRVDSDRLIEGTATPAGDTATPVAAPAPPHHAPAPPDSTAVPAIRRSAGDLEPPPHVTRVSDLAVPSSVATTTPRPLVDTPAEPPPPGHVQHAVSPAPQAHTFVPPALLVPRAQQAADNVHPAAPAQQAHPTVSAAPPPVTVTIGRIEVRAVTPPPRRERTTVDRHRALSLEDYLNRRRGGQR